MLAFRVDNANLVPVFKPMPKLRPGWALVRVRLAGICNTDIEILRGYHHFRGTPGHEFVGEVADVRGLSAQQSKRWLGQRVTGEINVSCAAYGYRPICAFCRRGLRTHCARRTVLGIVAHDGAFAEYLALPLQNLHRVPDSVTDQQAVFVEPLAAACEILDQLKIENFREAAVLGDGKLAQLVVRVLRTKLRHVVMFGKHEKKLALARLAGVRTKRVRGNASDAKHFKKNYSLVIDATGSPTGLTVAQQITEPRGTLVLKSTFHGVAPVETWPIVVKELTVIGSRCGPFPKALALIRSRKVDPMPLIPHLSLERRLGGDPLCAKIKCNESLAATIRQTVGAQHCCAPSRHDAENSVCSAGFQVIPTATAAFSCAQFFRARRTDRRGTALLRPISARCQNSLVSAGFRLIPAATVD